MRFRRNLRDTCEGAKRLTMVNKTYPKKKQPVQQKIMWTPKPALKRSYGKYDLNPKTVDKPELKVKDISLATINTQANASFSTPIFMSGLQQGTTNGSRVGTKVTWKKLQLRYSVSPTGTNQVIAPRIVVIYDRHPNAGVAPLTPTQVFQSDRIDSFNNLSGRDRFLTIIDECPDIYANSTGIMSRKINLESIFNSGNTGTDTDVVTGAFYYFFAGLGNPAQITYITARLRYTDC